MSQLWKRQYKLHFPDLGFGFDNTDDNAEGLKISFSIEKDLSQKTNKSTLKIWNLTNTSRAKIEKPDTLLEIYAGYKENGGPVKIFKGTVVQAETKDEGKDVTTELKLADGEVAFRDSLVSISFQPDTPGKMVVDTLASEMGLTISYAPDAIVPLMESYKNGYSYAGYAAESMTEVCNAYGVDWSVQNGIIQVILAGGTFADRGVVFSPSSGLIGSPSRIIRSKPSEDRETNSEKLRRQQKKEKPEKHAGWEIKTLLTPSINPGYAVKVESRMTSGWFRVEAVTHAGESYGTGTWESNFKLIEGLG